MPSLALGCYPINVSYIWILGLSLHRLSRNWLIHIHWKINNFESSNKSESKLWRPLMTNCFFFNPLNKEDPPKLVIRGIKIWQSCFNIINLTWLTRDCVCVHVNVGRKMITMSSSKFNWSGWKTNILIHSNFTVCFFLAFEPEHFPVLNFMICMW